MAQNGTKKITQLFEGLQGSIEEFKLITPKPITGTYFENNLSRFCLAGLPMVAILDFLSHLKSKRVEIQNVSLLPPNLLLEF